MLLDVAYEAARAAGEVLLSMAERGVSVRHKGEVDLVTDADAAAEKTIIEILQRRTPDFAILAEESGDVATGSAGRWIVDPLDGTTNFAHGFPWYGVSIAAEVKGEIVVGVINHPSQNELFGAEKGLGATCNGRPIHVSTTSQLDQAFLATGFPYDRKRSRHNNYDNFIRFQQAAQACRRAGAASLDLACLAAGRFDGYWELKLKPWDVAAGILLVQEAGGRVSDYAGQKFHLEDVEILASNGPLHEAMSSLLLEGVRPQATRATA
ncbi:MAG: inositol monophosphatase [Desulfuromonas sp.]|nr:MAG: inositol monophosphatase [Desulfuromonas sp.]